jgi:outer membrane protein assembly factor BamB
MDAAGKYESVLIDLDVARPATPPGPPARPLWDPARRRTAIGVTLVAAVSLLAADTAAALDRAESTPSSVSRPVTVLVQGAPLAVVGDSLYTTADGESRLNAYSLRTGRRRWSAAIPRLTEPALIDAGSHLLLTTGPGHQTVAVDARSGVIRWQRLGAPIWLAPSNDRVAVATEQPGTDADRPGRTTVELVTVASGATSAVFRPATDYGPVSPVFTPDMGDRWTAGMFAREDANGGQLFDFTAGRTRRLDLPLPQPPADFGVGVGVGDRPFYETLLPARDVVMSTTGWGGRQLLTAYAGDPPRRRWSVPDLTIWRTRWCGALLCSASDQVVLALDPATGQIRWRSPGSLLWPASDRRLYSSTQTGAHGSTGIAVLDETTGRELLRRDAWRPVGLIEGARTPILAYSRTGQVLAVLDARYLTTVRVAVLPQAGDDCLASRTHIACRAGADTFRSWRYSS